MGNVEMRPALSRGWPLSAHLLALCLAVLLPAIALGGLALWQLIAAERMAIEARVLQIVKSLSSDLDREMLGYWRLGEALGASPGLRTGDVHGFELRVRKMQTGQDWSVILDDPDGRRLMNTVRPMGPITDTPADADLARRAAKFGIPRVTDLFYDGERRVPMAGVRIPIITGVGVGYVLTIAVPTQSLTELLNKDLGIPEATISIADSNNAILAQNRYHFEGVGKQMSQPAIDQLNQEEPVVRVVLPSGMEAIRAVVRSPTTHWTVSAVVPVAELARVSREEWSTFAIIATALIGLSSLLAAVFARRIAVPIQRLARIPNHGRLTMPPASGVAEVDRVGSALVHSIDELGASEQRLRLALVAAGAGVWEYDFRTKTATWSPEMLELYGFTGEPRPSRDHLWSFLLDEDRARIREEAQAQIAKGGPFATEFRFKRPDGAVIWVSSKGVVELDKNGRAQTARGIDQDITVQKEGDAQREALLRITAERLSEQQALYDSAPIGLVLLDRDLTIQRINRVLAAMIDRPVEDLIGKSVLDVLPHARDIFEEHLRSVLELGKSVSGIEFLSGPAEGSDAERCWTAQLYPLTIDGLVIGIGLVCEDITEKKQAQVTQAHLAAIIEAAVDGVVSVSPDGRVRSWNSGAERLFGYKAMEVIGRPGGFLVPPTLEGPGKDVFRKAMSGESVFVETIRRRKDGSDIPVSISASPMRDSRGQVIAVSIVYRDISEQKRREEHTRFIMRELSHRSKNLLAVIQAMGRQTARTSRSLEDFHARFNARIAGLARSHDLLVKQDWRGVPVTELVQGQLAPFVDRSEEQLSFAGPALSLKPEAAQNIGLALHELATNASKHGALSSPKGRIEIHWELAGQEGQRRFRMTWCERGGPKVVPPSDRGFGRTVVEIMVGRALDGEARLQWRTEGLEWHLDVPDTCVAAEAKQTWRWENIN